MCLAVYVASDVPLVALPWREERPEFCVEPSPTDRPAALSGTYIAYLGAHTGCGCGFLATDSDADALDGQRALTAFCACLASLLERGPVAVFIGWEGDQPEENVEMQALTAAQAVQPEHWHAFFDRGSMKPVVVRIETNGPL